MARLRALSQKAGQGLPARASDVLEFWFGATPAWPARGEPKVRNESGCCLEDIQQGYGRKTREKEIDTGERETTKKEERKGSPH